MNHDVNPVRTRRTALTTLLLATCVLGQETARENAPAIDTARSHEQRVEQRYARGTWTKGTLRDGIPITTLELTGWQRGALDVTDGMLRLPFHALGSARPAFVLEATVCDSASAAHGCLVQWLASLQSPRTMPTVEARGILVGDVGYVGPQNNGENALSWIAFVRGGVAVRLATVHLPGGSSVELAGAARAIDQALRARTTLEEDEKPRRPVALNLAPERGSVNAGDAVPLNLDLAPADAASHVQWTVGGTGQGYIERDAVGRTLLYTTRAGEITVAAEIAGANGAVSRRTTKLRVTPRR